MERFWRKVKKTPTCWEWTASKSHIGYGRIRVAHKLLTAHRVAWKLAGRTIPLDMKVLHKCDNRSCVRLSHLFIGTQADNVQDMIRKGRMARGTRRSSSKLTDKDIPKIRGLSKGGMSNYKIAAKYGVSAPTIWHIVHRKKWAHIE